MKIVNYLFLALVFISSCKDDTVDVPELSEDYGNGMYVVTDFGVSYFDYTDTNALIVENVFAKVNTTTIVNPKRIKFYNSKAYILGNRIYIADLATFGAESEISGFNNAVDFDFVSHNRLFVVDKGDAQVKVVDLKNMEITAEIETGENTKPTCIVSNHKRSFVLNGGGVPKIKKDSTVISINHRDGVIPLTDFSANIFVGDNPVSAFRSWFIYVLCQGVYNPDSTFNNTEASFHSIHPNIHSVNSTVLSNIYNADNLIPNHDASSFYFTTEDGIYKIVNSSLSFSQITNVMADVLQFNIEHFDNTDTTTIPVGMLYMNDLNNPKKLYKYNLYNSTFQDTLEFNSNIKEVQFY